MLDASRRSFLALLAPLALDAKWTQWRGAARDGHADDETGLADVWPQGGPPLLWTNSSIGIGFSSFSVAHGQIFTQGQLAGKQYLISLNPSTGQENWRLETGPEYVDDLDFGWGPRSAVTVDGDRLYAYNALGVLVCADPQGRQLWRLDTVAEFNPGNFDKPDGSRLTSYYGMGESPLVDGDRVIVQPGGNRASIVALNKFSGSLIWKSGSDPAAFSSAVVSLGGGVRQYVTMTSKALVSVRADDGEELWRYDRITTSGLHIATPIVKGDYVFASTAYDAGCALLKLQANGGDVSATEVYFNRNMQNHYSSSVLAGDYLYGFSNSILTAMEFQTGNVAWRDRSVGKGQAVLADGKLFILGEDGVLGLVEPSPEGYRELSRFEIGTRGKRTWTLPIISDGRLLVRDQELLRCYDVRARA